MNDIKVDSKVLRNKLKNGWILRPLTYRKYKEFKIFLARSFGLVVRVEDSHPRGFVGSNPTVYWMDVSNSSNYIYSGHRLM